MKKLLSIALVSLLISSTVFAGISGTATAGFGMDFGTKKYGFIDNETKITVDVDIATMDAESVTDGEVGASIKGNFGLGLMTNLGGITTADPVVDITVVPNAKDKFVGFGLPGNLSLYFVMDITEAKIFGENWSVSLLGLPGQPDYAKAFYGKTVKKELNDYGVLKKKYTDMFDWKVAGYSKGTGVQASVYDYVIGFSMLGVAEEKGAFATTAYVQTPSYALLDDQLSIQAAAVYSIDKVAGTDDAAKNAVQGSVKVAGDFDFGKLSLASDLGYDFAAEKFGADVAFKGNISPVTIDAYYATIATAKSGGKFTAGEYTAPSKVTIENLLSAQVGLNLAEFDVPVSLTIYGKDLINTQDLGLDAKFNIGDFAITAGAEYVIDSKELTAKGGFSWDYEEYFTLAASAEYTITCGTEKTNCLTAEASIESSSIIPGATLALEYGAGDNDMNFFKDQATAQDFGKLSAKCSISF